MEIKRSGAQPSGKGPAEGCTGTMRIDPLFGPAGSARAGFGWVQRKRSPEEELRPGDVVWFAPGEKDWHGAAATTAMSHIAIQEKLDGKAVDWMEHVSNEQYRR
jgi:hypothetical protein